MVGYGRVERWMTFCVEIIGDGMFLIGANGGIRLGREVKLRWWNVWKMQLCEVQSGGKKNAKCYNFILKKWKICIMHSGSWTEKIELFQKLVKSVFLIEIILLNELFPNFLRSNLLDGSWADVSTCHWSRFLYSIENLLSLVLNGIPGQKF